MLESILSYQIFLPLLGALLIMVLPKISDCSARWIALAASLASFALTVVMLFKFDGSSSDFQFMEKAQWFPTLGISYHLGVDGISVYFVALSTFLTPICIISCWKSITNRVKEFMIAFLILETFMVGTFCALDSILFYVFFEGVLIPMFIIIGVWGGKRRVYSAFKFFLYTLLGSVLMLIALMALYYQTGTTDIPELMTKQLPYTMQLWLFLAFFASFAVKMPMWPVHTWLPDAHVEAPTAGSVILAGVLLKMGGYGFLRFSLPMFPEASAYFTPMIFTLSIIAIVYTALVALVQEDMKKLIAYSSVSHMGFVTLGIFSANSQGVDGAMFQMLSHGIVSAALFLCVGVVYDRLHTREISRYGGLVKNMPKYATVFMVLMLGAVGLPGTSGFVGEFLTLMGSYQASTYAAVFATTGVVFGAAYMLVLYRRMIFGTQKNADAAAMPDLTKVEFAYFMPLVLMVILFGVAPGLVMKNISPTVENLLKHYHASTGQSANYAKVERSEATAMTDYLVNLLSPIVPELFMAVSGLLLLVLGVTLGDKSSSKIGWLTIAVLVCATGLLLQESWVRTEAFNGMFVIDQYAGIVKLMILSGLIVSIMLSIRYLDDEKMARFEYPILVLFSGLGMMLMVSAHDLLSLYMGLELQSLALYVLASIRRDNVKSSEAGLKYFILGAISSGMLLFGASLVYGYTGSTNFSLIGATLLQEPATIGALIGMVFLIAGLAFKISAAPFHMWTPDVYEGAPASVTAFFALVPKLAAIALLTRLLMEAFPGAIHQWQQIIWILSALSMAVGAFAALRQENIKRLLAYSSIGNMGFALVGLAAGTQDGVSSVLVYMAIYMVMTAGTFGIVLNMRRNGKSLELISDLSGISRHSPALAYSLAILMFSMSGIPPLAGFFGKFMVFKAAVGAGLYGLAVFGVVMSVVAAYYYLRIIKVMFFDEPVEKYDGRAPFARRLVIAVSVASILVFILNPSPLIDISHDAVELFFHE